MLHNNLNYNSLKHLCLPGITHGSALEMEDMLVFTSALLGKSCIPRGVWKEAVTGHP